MRSTRTPGSSSTSKTGRALRIETVVDDPNDLGIKSRLVHRQPDEPRDVRRLHLKGLTERAEGTSVYRTKIHNRPLRPLMAADQPPSLPEIRQALDTLDRHIAHTVDLVRLPQVV
jgi:hypothetical protein